MTGPDKKNQNKASPSGLISAMANGEALVSPLERKLAALILSDINFATHASITDIATWANVSPPTVTRFCRRLGCTSFSDFKVKLAQNAYVGLRFLYPETTTSTPAEVAEDIVAKAQNALFEMHRKLDLNRLAKAADLLAKASIIYALGAGGNSSLFAGELQNRLFRLGCRISVSCDYGINLMQAASAESGAVFIGSSISGRNTEMVHCFDILRKRKIPTIALTQDNSPVAEAADLTIPIELPEGQNIFRPTSTRYAFLAVIDIIANLVAYSDKKKSSRLLCAIKETLIEHRDGDDRYPLGD